MARVKVGIAYRPLFNWQSSSSSPFGRWQGRREWEGSRFELFRYAANTWHMDLGVINQVPKLVLKHLQTTKSRQNSPSLNFSGVGLPQPFNVSRLAHCQAHRPAPGAPTTRQCHRAGLQCHNRPPRCSWPPPPKHCRGPSAAQTS